MSLERFFASAAYAVVGASNDRTKFGNRVLRTYLAKGLTAYPVHPTEPSIEGHPAYKTVLELPKAVKSISVVTPPTVTEQIVQDAVAAGIQNIWMQPGAESEEAVAYARRHGVNVIADGSCVLVALGR